MRRFNITEIENGTLVLVYEYGDKLYAFCKEGEEHLIPRSNKSKTYYKADACVYGNIGDAKYVWVVNHKTRVMFQTSIIVDRIFVSEEDAELYAKELNEPDFSDYHSVDKIKVLREEK